MPKNPNNNQNPNNNYRQLFETIEDAFWLRSNSDMLYVSPGYERIWGVPVKTLYNNPNSYLNYIHASDKELVFKILNSQEYILSGTFNIEFRITRPDGKIRCIWAKSYPIKNKKGNIIRLAYIAHDITEKNNTLEALKTSELKLNELNNSKDKLFSIISHDLRNPLSAIVGYAGLLSDEYENYNDEKRKVFIKYISDAANNTLKLLQNLLEWSRLQIGRFEIKPELFNIAILINEVQLILEPQATNKKINFSVNIAQQLFVYADRTMIKIVLVNLITNAIKFSHPNSFINIDTFQRQKKVITSIIDSGIGMLNETTQNLFNIEKKTTKAGTAREKGSGLGLLICKEFIEKNKGELFIKSELNKGSEFSFALPCNHID